ncbi:MULTISPECIES: sulfatase-like hydrolase/transferase [unclassified Yoonia]|uniref:sulfatase-like hydrolase/transferase n=1 Tax=unclassified Yoonia TaxID=2629118 RepID=UPI002AFDDEC8|nr:MULTISPECIES: sulfatase-like hydrolase/transferase [unclassified Yoonia]
MFDGILIGSLLMGLLGAGLLVRTGPGTAVKFLATIGLIVSLLLSSTYLIADQLTGRGFDASIVFHLTAGMAGAPFIEFLPQILGGIALAFVAVLTGVFVYRGMGALRQNHASARKYAGVGLIMLSVATSPGTRDVVRLTASMLPTGSGAPDTFLVVDQLSEAENPKNFILLFVEQLESTYFNEDVFPGLLPRMTALQDEGIRFTNVDQVTGTGWSIAGMTSSLCGVPLVGSGASNSMSGVDQFMPLAICLGDLLQPQGYRLHHLVGSDLDFAGWNNFFLNHGFESVEGLFELSPDLPADTVYSSWGLHDETLLSVATERLQQLSEGDRPFGMVLNMLDTHHPAGHPSPACQAEPYGTGEIPLLTAYACADRLVTQWIAELRGAGLLENTVVMISSDHLSMPNDVWDRLQGHERRNTVLVLGDDIAPAQVDRAGSLLDLGSTLLNLIGYDVPGIGLGRDLLADPADDTDRIADIESAISDSRGYISALWSLPNLSESVAVDVTTRQLHLGDRSISIPALMQFDDAGMTTAIQFDFYETSPLWTFALQMGGGESFLWFDECSNVSEVFSGMDSSGNVLCAAYGHYGTPNIWGVRLDVGATIDLSRLRSGGVRPRDDAPDGSRRLGMAVTDADEDTTFTLVASGVQPDQSYVRADNQQDVLFLPRGISVVGLQDDGSAVMLDTADSCGFPLPVDDLPPLDFSVADTVAAQASNYDMIAVMVHDSAYCDRYELAPFFAGSEFSDWTQIGYRTPYIALRSAQGALVEKLGASETSITLSTDAAEGE